METAHIAPAFLNLYDDFPVLSIAPDLVVATDDGATDEQLMQRYRNGDVGAFHVLYRRYGDRLYRFILRMSPNPAETDEIFQEVWIAVIRAKERYHATAKFVTYLFSIAYRRTMDRYRTQSRRIADSSDDSDQNEIVESEDTAPAVLLWRAETSEALLDAISKLPAAQRVAFLMHAEGDLDVEQIAVATETSRETVKSRLRYANKRLRVALEAWR